MSSGLSSSLTKGTIARRFSSLTVRWRVTVGMSLVVTVGMKGIIARLVVHLRAQRAGFARMCTHTVHIHKIQIAHVQDILHTRAILYLEAGHTHWVIIEVLVCGRFRRSSASSSEWEMFLITTQNTSKKTKIISISPLEANDHQKRGIYPHSTVLAVSRDCSCDLFY